jgi:hypothetical protein
MSSNDPTISDVEALSSTGWSQLNDTKKQALLDDAIEETDTLYTDRYARLPTLEGSRSIFIKNLTAHKWEIAEGGEAQSESNQGGNVSYNTVTGDAIQHLQQTRYGREALNHVRDRQGIGIVRSRY